MATQTLANLGTGGTALNAQIGSTTGSDSNDPMFLDCTGTPYVYLPGVNGNTMATPDAAALDITGDIDVRMQVAMDDWTPAAVQVLASKLSIAANYSWYLYLNTDGTLAFSHSSDGTALKTATSSAATGVTDGAVKWIRATLDVNNGAGGWDVKFYTSDDNVTYSQLGVTRTTATVTSIFSGTSQIEIGGYLIGAQTMAGKVYRLLIYSDLTGTTKVLDVDASVLTTGSAATFTAVTGQTITINRSAAARKAVAVVSPCYLFGSDDYMTIADNSLLDFAAADPFTVVAVVRQWATPYPYGAFASKRSGASGAGYDISSNNTALSNRTFVTDGANSAGPTTAVATSGALSSIVLVVDRAAVVARPYLNAVAGSTASTSAVGSLANAMSFRVGSMGDSTYYQDFELISVAVFRRILSTTEIASISTYYQARLS